MKLDENESIFFHNFINMIMIMKKFITTGRSLRRNRPKTYLYNFWSVTPTADDLTAAEETQRSYRFLRDGTAPRRNYSVL
jgi:hypothetical protein